MLEWINAAELLFPGGWRCRCWKHRNCWEVGVEEDAESGRREDGGDEG
jgi:hypothetical protein